MKVTALAGGVGAAKFLKGLSKLLIPEELSIIVNTADDIELFGLHISPDIDIVTYTLAGIVDEIKGWGIKEDTFHCLENLKMLGEIAWFNIGDRDLATHIYRTQRLRYGVALSEVTKEICLRLGLKNKILPMTNDKFQTHIITPRGPMHFEEYFIKHRCQEKVLGIEFFGQKTAKPLPDVLDAILKSELVIICPSNPIVSIGTILSVEGVRDALKLTKACVVGVSPIIAGIALKGPAAEMLRSLGSEVSAFGVAKLYSDFLDFFVIDSKDADLKNRIEDLGISVIVANTVMKSLADTVLLAQTVLDIQSRL